VSSPSDKKKKANKADDFEQVAKDLGCDEAEDALDKAFDSVKVKTEHEEKPDKD
jgi:hypothetical protein